ncbi:hypothetical protein Glove_586g33 [Diversispora epigaea]|uniref:Uncharacterized protein n=1 Tax=Diversispora epigaea TaxID=1348612 RepID=A0A397GBK7_9GLOM|nr:hypothetical protein Glove_586g33 [Diversispora epigaea]
MSPFVFFYNCKFYIVQTIRELENILDYSLKAIPEIYNFFYDNFNGHPNNSETPTATKLITSLNAAFKHLTNDISQIPISVLAALEKIFGMNCCRFDIRGDVSFILFRPTKTGSIYEKWIKQITEIFNALLKYWKNCMLEQPMVL